MVRRSVDIVLAYDVQIELEGTMWIATGHSCVADISIAEAIWLAPGHEYSLPMSFSFEMTYVLSY